MGEISETFPVVLEESAAVFVRHVFTTVRQRLGAGKWASRVFRGIWEYMNSLVLMLELS